MTSFLVTGGAGFVGSHLARGLRLHYPDSTIVALDNLRRRGAELNLPRLRESNIQFRHGDIRNPDDIADAGGFDVLVECSAEPSVLAGYGESPRYVVDTNLSGTVNCLEAARRHGAATIFLSTSRVYPVAALKSLAYVEAKTRFQLAAEQSLPGISERGIAETFPLEGTRSLYGATKLCSELLMQEYLEMYGLKGVINRCGVLTGPWQMGKIDQGVVVLWAARHIYGGRLEYIGFGGQGKQVRDMLHVDDLLQLVLYELEHLDQVSGKTYNVGGGAAVSASLLELTQYCEQFTGNTIEIGSNPQDRPADIPLYITDNTKVTAETGWAPQRDVPYILSEICDWIRDNQEALRPVLS